MYGWSVLEVSFPHFSMSILVTTAAAIIIALSGAAAAESSLPGDLLYSVKVDVNENVRAGLTLTNHGRALWNIRRAERRLEEVEALLSADTLTQAEVDAAEASFRAHAEAAKREIGVLRASGNIAAAAEASADLEAALRAHASALARITLQRGNVRQLLGRLLSSVEAEARVGGQIADDVARMDVEGSAFGSGMRVAAEASMKSAEHKIAQVRSFIDAKASVATAESLAEANARLETAEESRVAAEAQWNSGDYARAFRSVRTALHLAQEAKLLLERDSSDRDEQEEGSSSSSMTSSSLASSSDDAEGEEVEDEVEDDDRDDQAEVKVKINGQQGGNNATLEGNVSAILGY